ncbi:MAG: Gfo/Idh/MocA family oxidoreductase, partial [Pseudobutyrivibrio sp.]|nr:Gfo/Idh/MocA family oxidoreductase [Pseudobutyrivibrio sp.]
MGNRINIAIIGAGHIAEKMSRTLKDLEDRVNLYAISSRDLKKAETFAKEWGFDKAFGSYEEMLMDDAIDLVYVATPHSHHFEHAMLCLKHNRPCLVEKPFTVNAVQAQKVISLARQKKVFVGEAIWTRFIPARHIIEEVIASGAIGEVQSMDADYLAPIAAKERMYNPDLAGGALLDLGIYPLTFASMFFGDDIIKMESSCEKYETGVDATDDITLVYRDGKKAHIRTSMVEGPSNQATIYGSIGSLHVEVINNFSEIVRFNENGQKVEEYEIPPQISGYEYEVLSAIEAIDNGRLESQEMPHELTLKMMKLMDKLRDDWNMEYPFEKEKQVVIGNDKITAVINYHGAELRSLTKNGKEFMWQADLEFWGRTSPVLFPFVGQVAEGKFRVACKEFSMGQHGFARDMDFELETSDATSCSFVLKSNEETKAKYPFDFVLHISYELVGEELKVKWTVENPADEKLQFSIGAHPAFNCDLNKTSIVISKDGKGLDSFVNSVFGKGLLTDKKETVSL